MKITATIDDQAARRKIAKLRSKTPVAIVRVINRQAVSLRLRASQKIREGLALPATYVRARLFIHRASVGKPIARVSAKRRGLLLNRFKHKQLWQPTKDPRAKNAKKPAGIQVEIKPGQRITVRRWWLIRGLRGSQTTGIAIRSGGQGRNAYEVLHGPSVSQAFQTVRDDLSRELRGKFKQAVSQELRRIYAYTGP